MDQRTYEFSTLSERLSAQTAAYVEFSNALVKIIEQIAATRDKLNEFNQNIIKEQKEIHEEQQELNDKLNQVSSMVHALHSDIKHQHQILIKENSEIVSKMSHIESKIKELFDEVEDSLDSLRNIANVHLDLTKNISAENNKIIEEQNRLIKDLTKKIESQNVIITDFSKIAERFRMLWWVVGIITAVFGILFSFNILSFSWFGKK